MQLKLTFILERSKAINKSEFLMSVLLKILKLLVTGVCLSVLSLLGGSAQHMFISNPNTVRVTASIYDQPD